MKKRYVLQITIFMVLSLLSLVAIRPSGTKAGVFDATSEVTYKEYWVAHAQFTGGCGENEKPGGSWYLEPYLCEKTVSFQIPDDFSQALKAEIYLDLWRNHDGRLARFSINNGQVYAPNVGSDWSRTPYIGEIALSDLRLGTNTMTFQPGGYHVHDIAVRIYYDDTHPLVAGPGSDVTPPDGALLTIQGDGAEINAGTGGNLVVNGNQLTMKAEVSDGAKYVEFHSHYFGYDEDNDGQWRDWHNRGRNNWFPGGTDEKATGGAIDHPGTVATLNDGTYSVNWDVSTVPDQDGIKFKIRVVDDAGNVREAAGGISKEFSLSRSKGLVAFWEPSFIDAGLYMEEKQPSIAKRNFYMPYEYTASNYDSGIMVHSFWRNAVANINDESNIWPNFTNDDFWQLSISNINHSNLWPWLNKIGYEYQPNVEEKTGPGAFVEEPGPLFLLERSSWAIDNQAPIIYNELPAPDAVKVIAGTLIRFQLVDDQSGLDYSTIKMNIQGEDVDSAVMGAKHSTLVWYRPAIGFEPNEEVEVAVEACDLQGNCLNKSYSFKVDGEREPTGITSDDFNSCSLNESVWEFRDPVSNSNYMVNGAKIEISVPAGSNHDLWKDANDAPRIMQPANDVDFLISAKFDSTVEARYQLQGLIIAEDDLNFIRYSMVHDGDQAYIEAYVFENGNPIQNLNLPFDDSLPYSAPIYLGVDRSGNSWRYLYLGENEQWVELRDFDYSLTVTEVGVFAGNKGVPASAAPAFVSSVDNFLVDDDPIDPQDQNPLYLPVEIIGEGVVEKTPNCGSPVTLTAAPTEGHFFQGWSSNMGELSGRTNPLTGYEFTAGEVISASFHVDELYLNVDVENDGSGEGGSVTISPDKAVYSFEDEVTIIANTPVGWDFLGWSGDVEAGDENDNPLLIMMDDDINVTASFAAQPVTLQVDTEGMGTVDISPDKSGAYQYGDAVSLMPIAADGWSFIQWEGAHSGSERPLVLNLEANTEITAVFEERPPGLYLPFIIR